MEVFDAPPHHPPPQMRSRASSAREGAGRFGASSGALERHAAPHAGGGNGGGARHGGDFRRYHQEERGFGRGGTTINENQFQVGHGQRNVGETEGVSLGGKNVKEMTWFGLFLRGLKMRCFFVKS